MCLFDFLNNRKYNYRNKVDKGFVMLSARYVPPALKHGFSKGDIVMAPVSKYKVATFLVEEVLSETSMQVIAFNSETGELTSFGRVIKGDALDRFSIDAVATRFRRLLQESENAK